jgi:XTP/dITP diphosphohydrolase
LHHVTFASTNQNKFIEVQAILSAFDITVQFAKLDLVEVQSDSLEDIAREKATSAFAELKRPVIVEDDGLFIDALNDFPGPYSSFVFRTIGNKGILKLLSGTGQRSASFHSLVAYHDGRNTSILEGIAEGHISDEIAEGGWGYDPIFVPSGAGSTFAQLKEGKNNYSHRRKALEKFSHFISSLKG